MLSSGYTPTILLRKMIQRDVNITLPKFNIQFDMEMSPTLQKVYFNCIYQIICSLSYPAYVGIIQLNYYRWAFAICSQMKQIFPV